MFVTLVVAFDGRMPNGMVGVRVAALNVPLVVRGKNPVPVPVPTKPVPKPTLMPVGATTMSVSEGVLAVVVPLSTIVTVTVVVLPSLSVDRDRGVMSVAVLARMVVLKNVKVKAVMFNGRIVLRGKGCAVTVGKGVKERLTV